MANKKITIEISIPAEKIGDPKALEHIQKEVGEALKEGYEYLEKREGDHIIFKDKWAV